MQIKELKEITTKTGFAIKESWCRKCSKMLPASEFYECVDTGFIDTNGLMSVCKNCIQNIFDKIYDENGSIEKTIHKICTSLNIRFSNEAVSATKAHITTLQENKKNINAVFSIYKMKLTATKKSMDKSGLEDMSYEDVGTVYTSDTVNLKEIPIPQDVINFWGKDLKKPDIEFLEQQYANFKQTHKADSYTEVTLLKEVCFTLLDIKQARAQGDDTEKLHKTLQALMNSLAITPKSSKENDVNKGNESFGLWIQDIEQYEPAQWLKTDPRGDIYRDVANIEEYFQKYIVRPLKNFILSSKDFNTSEDENIDDDIAMTADDVVSYDDLDDGDIGD